jgi:phosphatidylglycerophosphate synthase
MPLIPKTIERLLDRSLDAVSRSPFVLKLSPNLISVAGLLIGLASAFLFAEGKFTRAGILLAASGLLDMLDGKIAKISGKKSLFGGVFDATLDRGTELSVYTGIGAYFILRDMHLTSLFVVLAAGGSWLVSYVRARAESFGIPCHVGFLRRGERFVLLAGGAILSFVPDPFHDAVKFVIDFVGLEVAYTYPPMPLTISIFLMAFLTQITIVQRLRHVWKVTKAGAGPKY